MRFRSGVKRRTTRRAKARSQLESRSSALCRKEIGPDQRRLAYKALLVWLATFGLGTLVGFMSLPPEYLPLFSHVIGFGFFLNITTGKTRWLGALAVGGFVFFGVLYWSMPTAWVPLASHTTGFATMMLVVLLVSCVCTTNPKVREEVMRTELFQQGAILMEQQRVSFQRAFSRLQGQEIQEGSVEDGTDRRHPLSAAEAAAAQTSNVLKSSTREALCVVIRQLNSQVLELERNSAMEKQEMNQTIEDLRKTLDTEKRARVLSELKSARTAELLEQERKANRQQHRRPQPQSANPALAAAAGMGASAAGQSENVHSNRLSRRVAELDCEVESLQAELDQMGQRSEKAEAERARLNKVLQVEREQHREASLEHSRSVARAVEAAQDAGRRRMSKLARQIQELQARCQLELEEKRRLKRKLAEANGKHRVVGSGKDAANRSLALSRDDLVQQLKEIQQAESDARAQLIGVEHKLAASMEARVALEDQVEQMRIQLEMKEPRAQPAAAAPDVRELQILRGEGLDRLSLAELEEASQQVEALAAKLRDARHQLIAVENQRLKDKLTCGICMEAEIGVVFLPCGHCICCTECAQQVTCCPICRSQLQGIKNLFVA